MISPPTLATLTSANLAKKAVGAAANTLKATLVTSGPTLSRQPQHHCTQCMRFMLITHGSTGKQLHTVQGEKDRIAASLSGQRAAYFTFNDWTGLP